MRKPYTLLLHTSYSSSKFDRFEPFGSSDLVYIADKLDGIDNDMVKKFNDLVHGIHFQVHRQLTSWH